MAASSLEQHAAPHHTASTVLDVNRFMPASLHSEGPTPGVLQEMLDNIDKYTEQVRCDLFLTLMGSLSGSGDPGVLSALSALAGVPSSSGTEQWVAQCADKYMEVQQHVAALQAELKAAQAAADLEATLGEFHAFIRNGQFSDAAYSLMQLRKILEDDGGSASASASAGSELAALRDGCAACERSLEQALSSSLAQAFVLSHDSGQLSIHCALPGGGHVGDLWTAMEVAGSLKQHMAAVAGTLLQDVLPGVLNGSCCLEASVQPDGSAAFVRWYANAARGADGSASREHVEAQCVQLLSVLAQSLFCQQPAALSAFGAAFWGPFVAAYEGAFLQHIQGSSVAALQARQQAACDMEQHALSMGLAEPGSALAGALSRAIRQSYHAVQEQFLAAARDLLLAYDAHAEPAVVGQPLPLDAAFFERYQAKAVKAWEALDPPCGWDTSGPVLATGYFHVTPTALQLVMLMDDALSQACEQGDTSVAQAIIGAVSKMALMFATMLPPPAAAEAPLLALLRHNDLQYIASHLLVLPFLFDPDLKPLLGASLWFGTEAMQLRTAARGAYNDLLSVQVSAVMEQVQPLLQASAALSAGGSAAAKPKGGDAEGAAGAALERVLYLLTRAGRLLWGHMAPASALEASQALVEPLAGEVVQDILSKRDIGESEGAELVRLYEPLLARVLPALLGGVHLAHQEISAPGVDLQQLVLESLQCRCRALQTARAVLTLLTQRLADIVEAWESGALAAAGLSLRDVASLVHALFEDTDYRAVCLQRMEVAAQPA